MTRAGNDPRLTGEQVQRIPGRTGTITLVGVVHDHPASKYRVKSVIEADKPDVLALELPSVALPLFEEYARDEREPPLFGGEMSTAIQTASTSNVVGIDGPTPRFVLELVRTLFAERASLSTGRQVGKNLLSASKDALVCRAASALASHTSVRLAVDSPVEYETSWHDDPETQAANERTQLRRAHAVMNAFEPSRAVQFQDRAREAHMADRLERLSRQGDVVAIVGSGHLDPLVERLTDET